MLGLLGGIHLGPFFLPYSTIGLILAVLAGAWAVGRGPWADREAVTNRGQRANEAALSAYWNGAVAGLLGHRFAGLVITPTAWWEEPGRAFLSVPPPESAWVAGAAAAAALGLTARRRGLTIGALLDRLFPALLLSAAVYNLFTLDVGRETSLPWGIRVGDSLHHPVNVYRALFFLFAFIVVRTVSGGTRTTGRLRRNVRPSAVAAFLFGVALLAGGYTDQPETPVFGLRKDQWFSVLLMAGGAFVIARSGAPPAATPKAGSGDPESAVPHPTGTRDR